MSYIIGGGQIITLDPERRIINDGAVLVEENKITDIGKAKDLKEKFPKKEWIDVTGHIIMPGFIDGHVHLAQAMIRGCADDLNLIDWLSKRVWKLQGNYTEEDGKTSAELCILEMLKSGTTTFAESLLAGRYGFEGIIEAVINSGIRGALAKSIMDKTTYREEESIMYPGMVEDGKECLEQAISLHKSWEGAENDRVFIWLGPRPIGGSTPELLEEVGKVAKERNMGIHIHFCEVEKEAKFIKENFKINPGAFAERMGILGPKTLLVHGVWLEEEDLEYIVKSGSTLVHNPAANMKVALGFSPIPQLIKMGGNIGLACDGGPSNNTYDMLQEMKMAACIHKGITLDPEVVPAEKVIEMATINGAKSLGLHSLIGSLEVGKRADLITINCEKPHLTPNPNPVSTIVYSATGKDVENVIVEGKILVRNGEVLSMDEEKIKFQAKKQVKSLLERTNTKIPPMWPVV